MLYFEAPPAIRPACSEETWIGKNKEETLLLSLACY